MIKLVRSPNVKFQERASGAWSDRILSVAGGGTGSTTSSDARTALGLGTMAIQNSSAVSISGGTLAGDGAGLTNLAAPNVATGNLSPQRMPVGGSWATLTSNLVVPGHRFSVAGFGASIVGSVGSPASLVDTDFVMVAFHTPATLPSPSGRAGAIYVVKRWSASDIVVNCSGGATIDGVSTYTLRRDFETIMVQTNGTDWFIIGKSGGGSVRDIFHGDVSFGTGDLTHDSTVTWEGGTPASIDEISVNFGGPAASDGNGNASWFVGYEWISTTVIRFYKTKGGGTGTAPLASAHYFTAFWHDGVS